MKSLIANLVALLVAVPAAVAQTTSEADQRAAEREAYAQAKRLNTVDGWEIFINNYPESFFIEQARKLRDAAIVNSYCNHATTLERLVTYIDEEKVQEPRIRMFYANLVNNPTHSYRFEHMDVGFNGCTGTVREHITFANGGKARDNVYVFNEQGLLTESHVTGSRGNVVATTYAYAYDNLHGYTLKSSTRKGGVTVDYEPFFNADDKLEILTSDGTHKQKWVYTYNDKGGLQKLVVTDGDQRRVLVYNDGYIIREEREGRAFRYYYDYDSATFKKYLIGISEIEDNGPGHERKFNYKIDTHGRLTSVEITQDGKPEMTITRTYE